MGADAAETVDLLNFAGLVHSKAGKSPHAEQLFKHSLAIRDSRLSKHHPDVATCLNNLAALYRCQCKYAKAEQLFQRSLAIHEAQWDKGHPTVATLLNNLAILYQDMGQYARAEPHCQRSLVICEARLCKDHPEEAGGMMELDGSLTGLIGRRSITIKCLGSLP
jgi:tetratricopeptide (TPR) repeat protein